MSKFNSYARRLDNAAKKIFSEYQEAEAKFERAESAKKNGPRPIHGGFQDAQTAAKIARLEADYQEARAVLDGARRNLPDRGKKEFQTIRAELIAAINSAFTVDPAQVDTAALEIMKSGICTAKDYEKLLANVDESNTTMIRLIADFAKKAYEAAQQKRENDPYGHVDHEELARLYNISIQGQRDTEKSLLTSFDALTDIFQRCMNNSGVISYWNELTGPIIEAF